MRFVRISSCFLSLALLGAPSALANSGGISGFSGQNGSTCAQCHTGGTAPGIQIDGPQVAETGKTYRFSVLLRNAGANQTAGGVGVSADSGTLAPVNGDTKLLNGEIVHTAPKAENASREILFEFDWTAPASPMTSVIYAAGCSVNLDGSTPGDADAATGIKIQVEDCVVEQVQYGKGTSGSNGRVPLLDGQAGPCANGSRILLSDALGSASTFFLVSFQQAALPYGNRGGQLLVDIFDPSFRFLHSATDSSGRIDLQVGDITALDGLSLNVQAAVLDAAAGSDNFALSNGLELQISL